jgi:hypothetical protein
MTRKWTNTADATKGRTQRQTWHSACRSRLLAQIVRVPNAPKNIKSYREQFELRLERGQILIHPIWPVENFRLWARNYQTRSDGRAILMPVDLYDVFDLLALGRVRTVLGYLFFEV